MSTPPQHPGGNEPLPGSDDRTRDIRLPSLPDRPHSAVRPEWRSPSPQSAADRPASAAEQPEPGNAAPPAASPVRSEEPAPPRPYVLPDELTDKMSAPPPVRQQTLAFDAPGGTPPAPVAPPAAGRTPAWHSPVPPAFAPPVQSAPPHGPHGHAPARAPERNRRWPWVVLTVLPILVIIGAGLMLLFLLRGG